MHHHTENEFSLSSLFSLLSALVLSSSLSSPLLPLSLSSFSVSVSLCLSPCGVVSLCLCGVCGVVVWCETQKNPVCPFKTSPCVRSQRPRVCRHHAHSCFNMCAWCRYTLGRFECTHGGLFCTYTRGGRGSSLVLFTKICPHRVITCFRFTKSNHWILPILSLRIGRTRNVPDSSNHSLYLIKMLSSNPEGKNVGSYKFFCSIIERSALARCNVLIIRSKKEHSSDYLFSDLRAISFLLSLLLFIFL